VVADNLGQGSEASLVGDAVAETIPERDAELAAGLLQAGEFG